MNDRISLHTGGWLDLIDLDRREKIDLSIELEDAWPVDVYVFKLYNDPYDMKTPFFSKEMAIDGLILRLELLSNSIPEGKNNGFYEVFAEGQEKIIIKGKVIYS